MDKYETYLHEVKFECKMFPNRRFGQNAFNALWNLHPEIADKVRGTVFDPFYEEHEHTERCHRFHNFVYLELS